MSLEDLKLALRGLANLGLPENATEEEVRLSYFQEGFFSALGYQEIGQDIRLEAPTGRGYADVVLRGFAQQPLAIIEFKRPGVSLARQRPQLERYTDRMQPKVGVLANDSDILLYRITRGRLSSRPFLRISLAPLLEPTIPEEDRRSLYDALHKREVDITLLSSVREVVDESLEEPIRVTDPTSPGGRDFLDRFSILDISPFGRLVMTLCKWLSHLKETNNFTQGAYAFWRRVYARDVGEAGVPNVWRPFIDLLGQGAEVRYEFMFSLETAYALLARILLAKAMQDAELNINVQDTYLSSLEHSSRRGRLEPRDHLQAVQAVLNRGEREAFSTLFTNDIFDWWLEAGLLDQQYPETFDGLVESVIALMQYDFSGLKGDFLGQLYQSYFDPETRKALGEFYTPPEVVEFILDEVGYKGARILTQRLLDPACGSGTFLIAALRRYFKSSEGLPPKDVLHRLIHGLQIVGFDINPFACLMAQVNFAAHIVPLYKQAIREDPNFTIAALPIFRTDSLRQEYREREQLHRGEIQQEPIELTYEGDINYVITALPIQEPSGNFHSVSIPLPSYLKARELGLIDNLEAYFQALRIIFEVVRENNTEEKELAQRFEERGIRNHRDLANFVNQAVQELQGNFTNLQEQFDDGRFLKTMEDLSLACDLKNRRTYDYVVGNPPYVRIQNIPEESRRYWERHYEWAERGFDIFVPFIERAITKWLGDGGKLGFICSNRFLSVRYGEKLRQKLPSYAAVKLIFDFRDTRVFADALNYPAILIAEKGATENDFPVIRVFGEKEEREGQLLREARETLDHIRRGRQYKRKRLLDGFPQSPRYLTESGWYLMPSKERRVFRALSRGANKTLEELTATQSGGFAGYQTSADGLLVFELIEDRGELLLVKPKDSTASIEIERDILRPFLFGKDVARWDILWQNWYVWFPYVQIEEQFDLVPARKMMEDYPLAWKYARRHEEQLRAREGNRYRADTGRKEATQWYGATRPQNLEWFGTNKIVAQISSTEADFAFDDVGYVFQAGGRGGGVYGIALRPEIDHYFVLGLLNSMALDFFLKHVSIVYSGKSYSYSDYFIKQLPIKLPPTDGEKEEAETISDVAKRLTVLSLRARKAKEALEGFPETLLDRLPSSESLYPLNNLARGLPTTQTMTIQSVEVEGRGGEGVVRFGRRELGLPTLAHAQCLAAWAERYPRRQVRVEELAALRFPRSAKGCGILLRELRKVEEEVAGLQDEIQSLEAENNEQVANYYGLRDSHVRVIEDFLKRF